MIRIDEIYQTVFLPRALKSSEVGLHWFDPFGSTDMQDICNLPPVDWIAKKRIIFWDQEPLSSIRTTLFLEEFLQKYRAHETYIVTSEKNSKLVNDLSEKFNLGHWYYFFHAWAALDWYRGYNRTFLFRPFSTRAISQMFLCPNNIIGGERLHRLKLLKELIDYNLIKNNQISFPAICPYEKQSIIEICEKHRINIDFSNINLPLSIDGGYHQTNSHRIDLWQSSEQTLLQVVTETVYQGQRHHLTEKTFKPIVMQQPFILVSCQGSLEYIRSYGFKTFNDFWDESYDFADDESRIGKIGKLLRDINNLSPAEINQLQKHLTATVEHNFQWFYSREFEDLLWKELSAVIESI